MLGRGKYDHFEETHTWDEDDWKELWTSRGLDGVGEAVLHMLWWIYLYTSGVITITFDEHKA